jgi:hypothetical protein
MQISLRLRFAPDYARQVADLGEIGGSRTLVRVGPVGPPGPPVEHMQHNNRIAESLFGKTISGQDNGKAETEKQRLPKRWCE